MAEAEQGSAPEDRGLGTLAVKRALRYRDGLMIALLAHHPLRLGNLVGLRLDRGLRGKARLVVEIDPADSKNGPLSGAAGADLVPPLERYLRHRRPQPPAAAAPIGPRRGSPARALHGAQHAHHRICRHTGRVRPAGQPAPVPRRPGHHDRRATARAVGIVTPLLGHRSIATAQRHYNRAGMTTAAEAWHDVLDQLSRE